MIITIGCLVHPRFLSKNINWLLIGVKTNWQMSFKHHAHETRYIAGSMLGQRRRVTPF